jgi:hypothetical protein
MSQYTWNDSNNIALQDERIPRYIPGLCYDSVSDRYRAYDAGSDGRTPPDRGCSVAKLRPKDLPGDFVHLLPGSFLKPCCDSWGPPTPESGFRSLPLSPEPDSFSLDEQNPYGAEGNSQGFRSFLTYEEAFSFINATELNQRIAKSKNICAIKKLRTMWLCIYGSKSWIDVQLGAY